MKTFRLSGPRTLLKSSGHKYTSRTKKPGGGYDYEYAGPASIDLTPHKNIARYPETVTYHVTKLDNGNVQLSRHKDAPHGVEMSPASVPHFVNDLSGRVDIPKHDSNEAINAVISGKAEVLGKGDDGVAFKVGDQVVKMSTTVPFQPENPGHRTPEGAKEMLRAQAEVGNKLADAGVPGIQRSKFVEHGDKGFQIKEHIDIPDKLTLKQLDDAQRTIHGMHEQGYYLNDTVQVGVDSKGGTVLFDIGKAGKDGDKDTDYADLKNLYYQHGHRDDFVNLSLSASELGWEQAAEHAFDIGGKSALMDKLARKRLTSAHEARVAHAEKTMKGAELSAQIAKIGEDWHATEWVLTKDLAKGGNHKYTKRVPKAGGGYNYYYAESAVARDVAEGDEISLGEKSVKVVSTADDGWLTLSIDGGPNFTVGPDEWGSILSKHYGSRYHSWAEKRAQQSVNAVLKHVPRALLEDLTGSDEERLAKLQERVPAVYAKLAASFQRSGVSPRRAQQILTSVLERKGWEPEARAAVVGNVITGRNKNYRQMIEGAENLAGGSKVKAKHVASFTELTEPVGGSFKESVNALAGKAEKALAALSAALSNAKEAGSEGSTEVLRTALANPSLNKLMMLSQAVPSLKDKAIEPVRQALLEVPSMSPVVVQASGPKEAGYRLPFVGAQTSVFVAGENGAPKALKAQYKLIEAGEVIASHKPGTFARHEGYPEGVQERAYHRDKSEQQKVIRNAQTMNPEFLVNTNPDAVNGPPIMDGNNVVLGGNSRTMSMQLAYTDHPAEAKKLKDYLASHAHEVGLKSSDVAGMKNPMLVRVVPTQDKAASKILVRQMNESFTQGMDPRTMQVAMGRKLDDAALSSLGDHMESDETLNTFLGSSRSEPFVNALMRTGIIDQRNANQYLMKDKKILNEDGRALVASVLVGKEVGDADLLSNTPTSVINNLARAVPLMAQAKQYGAGYDLSSDLKTALDAYNDLNHRAQQGHRPPLKADMSEREFGNLFNQEEMFSEPHPVTKAPAAMAMLEVLIRKNGTTKMAGVFKEYARKAKENPESQGGLFGAADPPAEIFQRVVADSMKKSITVRTLLKGGPYIGPRGGKYADPQHKIAWTDKDEKRGGVRTGVVKIDPKRVRETVDSLFDNAYGEPDKNGYRPYKQAARLQVRGDLYVELKHDPHARPGNLGYIRFEGGNNATITLQAADYVYGKSEVEAKQKLRRVLAHEVTHHTDPAMRTGKLADIVRGKTENAERDLKLPGEYASPATKHTAYLNLKHEVTAKLQEVHRDLIHPLVKRDYRNMEKEHGAPGGKGLVWFANKHSKVFKEVFKEYTPANQKRLLRMVASTLTGLHAGTVKPVVKSLSPVKIITLRKARKLHKRIEVHGMKISIENRKGSERHWYDAHAGKPGVTVMTHDYGYFRLTEGSDGDHLDCYIGPSKKSEIVFVVNQMKAPDFRKFDEHKCMMGFETLEEASKAYLRNFDDERFCGSIVPMHIDEFKEWAFSGKPKRGAVHSNLVVQT